MDRSGAKGDDGAVRRGEEAKEAIRTEAIEAGFDVLGFAPALLPAVEGERFTKWLDEGMHGTMEWIGRSSGGRSDASTLLPGAETVIIGAVNYHDPAWSPLPGGGRISRYAVGRDYHKVIRRFWRKAMPAIERLLPGVRGRWFVDSAPILEKAYAERAGLGWRGKHSNVIVPKKGSWFFLGGLVIDRELPADLPAADRCGTCRRCIDACPTGAIVEPYRVDSRRCISYLTIEHAGEVDHHLDEKSGDWIFGCDICQEVCPWNRFSSPCREKRFLPAEGTRRLTLNRAVRFDREAFDLFFRGTPVRRAGWERFRRAVKRAISYGKRME